MGWKGKKRNLSVDCPAHGPRRSQRDSYSVRRVARKNAHTKSGSTRDSVRTVVLGTGFPGVRGDPSNELMKGHKEEGIVEEEGATTTEDARYRKIAQPC